MSDIPFEKLGIPHNLRPMLAREASPKGKMPIAAGLVPMTTDVQLAVLYVLMGDPDGGVKKQARQALARLPAAMIEKTLAQRTHPKVLEAIAQVHEPDAALDERIMQIRNTNDRTARMIAQRAGPVLAEAIARNHERALMTPEIFLDLWANRSCPEPELERLQAFMRMENCLPRHPAERVFKDPPKKKIKSKALSGERRATAKRKAEARPPVEEDFSDDLLDDELIDDSIVDDKTAADDDFDDEVLDEELVDDGLLDDFDDDEPTDPKVDIQAADVFDKLQPVDDLDGAFEDGAFDEEDLDAGPEEELVDDASMDDFDDFEEGEELMGFEDEDLGMFEVNFKDEEDEFNLALLRADLEMKDGKEEEQTRSLEGLVRDMTVGQKIKLAYKGNKEARKILVKDSNKMVAVAVVKSGRLSDGEVLDIASNRNVEGDVLREISINGEFMRKYPVKAAMVANPKTPVPIAMGLIKWLQKSDLESLGRNKGVAGVVSATARKDFQRKFNPKKK